MGTPFYDISLKHPSTWIISGATGSGKSVFTNNLLKNKERLFKPSHPKYGVLFYRTWQPLYDEMKKNNLIHYFYEGVPTEEEIKKIFMSYSQEGGCFAIFDDLMTEIDDIEHPENHRQSETQHGIKCAVDQTDQQLPEQRLRGNSENLEHAMASNPSVER